MATITPPTSEIGATNQAATLPGWGKFSHGSVVDEAEHVPDLKWPKSVRKTYERMRNDYQLEALYYATTLPITRYRWCIDPNGARDEVVEKACRDYGLPLKGEPDSTIPLKGTSFDFYGHLDLVLQYLIFGHYFFEQVMEVGDDGLLHIRKLAPRAPRTIADFHVDPDGGLVGIRQTIGRPGDRMPNLIETGRLLFYVWQPEPGRFTGRSMFRACYQPWLLKDRLMRVDALKHERNGMGVPNAKQTIPDTLSADALQRAQEVMSSWRAGEDAGSVMPYGIEVELLGVKGTLPDTLASIKHYDEAMSRRWLGMLLNLGQTESGSRALGEVDADLIEMARDAIAGRIGKTFSDHQLADDVLWNFPSETHAPRLTYERPEDAAPSTPQPEPPAAPPVQARSRPATFKPARPALYAEQRARLASPSDRRREPSAREVQAAVDFDRVDLEHRGVLSGLLSDWEDVTASQIDSLVAQVETAAGDLDALARIEAPVEGADVIADAMRTASRQAAETARMEAAAQGVHLDPTPVMASTADMDPVEDGIVARAAAYALRLARSLSESAAWQAVTTTGADDLPAAVRTHLESLSGSYVEQRLGGAVSAAQTEGRAATQAAAEEEAGGAEYDACELLDTNTCTACAEHDNTTYTSLDEARRDYPGAGYIGCEGGDRCRGLLVQLLPEA
jgi:hypothetical protein